MTLSAAGVLAVPAANITGTLGASHIDVANITIGQSQVTNLTSALAGKASTSAANDAAKTATNYITTVTNAGIKIHDSADVTDYLQINSSYIGIFRNSVETLKIEDSALRVGKIGTDKRNVYITDSAVQIRNNTSVLAEYGSSIKLYKPGTTTAIVTIDSNGGSFSGSVTASGGSITGGLTVTGYFTTNSSRTTYNSTSATGITIDKNGIGGYGSATAYFNMTTGGVLTAYGATIGTGTIGGWSLTSTALSNGTYGSDNSTFISTENMASKAIGGRTGADWRLTVGSHFGVTNTGALYCNSANVYSASIGGGTNKITIGKNTVNNVAQSSIYYGMSSLASTTASGFYIGTDGIALGGGKFKVTATGSAVFKDATLGDPSAYHVSIDSDSLDILNNNTTLASFGSTTTIGKNNQFKTVIDYHSFKMVYGNETDPYVYFSDLRDTNGNATLVQTIVADGIATQYHLEAPATSITSVKIDNNVITTGYSLNTNTNYIVFTNAPTKGNVIRVEYVTTGIVRVYTLGTRISNGGFGRNSVAAGCGVEASGVASFSCGMDNGSLGEFSFSSGYKCSSIGYASTTFGASNTAKGERSLAFGYMNSANGSYSIAGGYNSYANQQLSFAFGRNVYASSHEFVIGQYNEASPDLVDDNYVGTYAFIIGNGTSSTPSNALTVDWSGNALFSGTVTATAFTGNASTATKLSAAQKVYVTLGTASTTTTIQGGSSSAQTIGVNGTLGVANGGTGKTTGANAANYFLNELTTSSSDAQAADYLIAQYAGGGTTTTTYHRRPVNKVVNATVVKAALGTNATHNNNFLRKDGSWAVPDITVSTLTMTRTNNSFIDATSFGRSAAYKIGHILILKGNFQITSAITKSTDFVEIGSISGATPTVSMFQTVPSTSNNIPITI